MRKKKDHGKLRKLARLEEPKPTATAISHRTENEHGHKHDARQREDGPRTPVEQLPIVDRRKDHIDDKADDSRPCVDCPEILQSSGGTRTAGRLNQSNAHPHEQKHADEHHPVQAQELGEESFHGTFSPSVRPNISAKTALTRGATVLLPDSPRSTIMAIATVGAS